jgi:hypothetical protein
LKNTLPLISVLVILLVACATHRNGVRLEQITLFLQIENADEVRFACSLDHFKLKTATRTGSKTWSVRVPGDRAFTYFFTVDGTYYLPDCKMKEKDDFGHENCIYVPEME